VGSVSSRAMSLRTPTAKAIPLVLVLTLLWGTNWALFPLAVREVSVWTFRATNLFGSGVLLLAVARMRGTPTAIPRRYWPTLLAASIVYLVIWNLASTYAAILIPSGQAAILGYTMPTWTVLVVWAVYGERPSPRTWVAVALATLGVLLLLVPAGRAYANAPAGFILGLVAGLSWAAGTVILKRANVRVPAIVLTGWQLLVASVPLGIGALWLAHGQWSTPSLQTVLVIGYITLVPMAVGNALWFSIVRLLPASVAGLSAVMVPIVAMITGAIARSEPLGPWQIGAMACCAGAVLLALSGRK
jgi:drug/metabolite transporter (DMT)-like permease